MHHFRCAVWIKSSRICSSLFFIFIQQSEPNPGLAGWLGCTVFSVEKVNTNSVLSFLISWTKPSCEKAASFESRVYYNRSGLYSGDDCSVCKYLLFLYFRYFRSSTLGCRLCSLCHSDGKDLSNHSIRKECQKKHPTQIHHLDNRYLWCDDPEGDLPGVFTYKSLWLISA